MGIDSCPDDCTVAGCFRPRRWKPNERTWSCGRKLALALHPGDVIVNRFRMAVRIDREVETSRERGFKRPVVGCGRRCFCSSEWLKLRPRTRSSKRERPD